MGSSGFRASQLTIFHAVLADGRIWVSGAQQMTDEGMCDFREDQAPQFSLFFGASEDIYGIPFYGIVYTYPLREERRVQLWGFDDLEPAWSWPTRYPARSTASRPSPPTPATSRCCPKPGRGRGPCRPPAV